MLSLGPLTGGGFWVAVSQVAAIYYGVSAAIHWGIPAVLTVKSIQVCTREEEMRRRAARAWAGVGGEASRQG